MCGIAVLMGSKDGARLTRMMDAMAHRGPDGRGTLEVGSCLLGHVRLSILDIEGGGQPMANERKNLVITFNGEIYNHLELRARLEGRHRLKTRSDTEILLHLYEEEGEDMLPSLDGMFALALAGPHGLLLARDPLGIKPLYYGYKDGVFMAASELKAFPPMDDLRQLPAGHAVVAGGEPWRFAPPFPPKSPLAVPPVEEVLSEIRRRLESAVIKRLMGDVPVGVFLSGGLDSSVVAALMRPHAVKLHSFTAGMEGAPDLPAAREMAAYLGADHHELIYTEQDVERALHSHVLRLPSRLPICQGRPHGRGSGRALRGLRLPPVPRRRSATQARTGRHHDPPSGH
jgi:asparagine synthase (glutamine-hydrolysing)